MGLLDGKVAVVTGAGRGIGREEALLLAARGRPGRRQRRRCRAARRGRRRRAPGRGGRRPDQGERRRGRGQRRRHQLVGRRQERGGPGDRHLRLARHPRQQRRDPAGQDVLQHGRVGLGRRDPGPPQGPLRGHPPRRRLLAQPGQGRRGRDRPHHQHLVGVGPLRQRRPGQLRRRQGRHRRAHLGRGPRARPLRRDGQRDRPPGPHPHDRDALRRRRHERDGGRLRRLGPQEHRQRRRPSSPRRRRPTSAGRSSSSSAPTSTP